MMVLADYKTLTLFVRLIDVWPIHCLVFANSIILYLSNKFTGRCKNIVLVCISITCFQIISQQNKLVNTNTVPNRSQC